MNNLLDQPVVNYLIIIGASLVVALLCFSLGDTYATVSGKQGEAFTYSASGALAGFIIVFFASYWVLRKLRREAEASRGAGAISVKVYVQAEPDNFDPPATKYTCEATLFNENTGERRTRQVTPRWEEGFLTVDLLDVSVADYVGAMITDDQNRLWYLQDFKPSDHRRKAEPLFIANNPGGDGNGA
jgi:hypothetical protein